MARRPACPAQRYFRGLRILHSANLMVDDIEDSTQLRRGQLVAHRIYAIPQPIYTANCVYFLAYKKLTELRDHDPGDRGWVVPNKDFWWSRSCRFIVGRVLRYFGRTHWTEEEYIAMVNSGRAYCFQVRRRSQ